ncbi:MAG: group II intron reverse transcriptase/maturase [Candidatus Brocadiaceae bacterium]|nr:group II intron reverse transcriptase/maturase [Candidatus Brocadiaceae bacterium]
MEQVLLAENMHKAWKQVKANKGIAGVDTMSVEEFPEFARNHWSRIREQLMEGSYKPLPVKRVEIPKPDGGKRPLGIPTVTDRVIQQAIAQVLAPVFDPGFSDSSYGFRPKRSAHDAVRKIREYIGQGYKYAVDIDLSKFFDMVNHDLLMQKVKICIKDKTLLRLINRYLKAGVQVNGKIEPTSQGVPHGGPLSPILSNIVLDELDKELEKRGHRFVRYADDFIILVKSHRAGERVMQSIKRFLLKNLKLVVNEKKSKVVKSDQCLFLGFVFKGKSIRWSDNSLAEFKRHIRLLTGRSWGVSMNYRLRKLAEYIRGWMGYYGLSEYYRPIPELDHWLRRRIRMCYWKQWRRCRKRVKELLNLGCSKRQAILTALSRKSYWHLSKTLATQMGMTNLWLKKQGLVSIRELWISFHYPVNPEKSS